MKREKPCKEKFKKAETSRKQLDKVVSKSPVRRDGK